VLKNIIDYKKLETQQKSEKFSISDIERLASKARPVRDMRKALQLTRMGIIAELKYRSPSKGILRVNFDPISLAYDYQKGGAAAISVLGDSHFFGGGPFMVAQVAGDERINTPILFKDFICSPYQVFEARASGADALLLIARILTLPELQELLALTHDLGMTALIETFDLDDIAKATDAGANLIGINNRDLRTFKVDFSRTAALVKKINSNALIISESGISEREEILMMEEIGFHAALIGESLLKAADPAEKIRQLLVVK
jgi:indole-3-glycerol phosphate synthase